MIARPPPPRFRLPLVLLLCLLPAVAARAHGSHHDPVPPPPPDPAQAARDMFAAGDYAGALNEFQRLLDETGNPDLHVDIARTLSHLDRPLEALDAFDAYLAVEGDALSAEDRQAIDAEVQAEWAKVGRILLHVDQSNVEVRLDGTPIGYTPLVTPLRVAAGPHVVELFHPRFADERREVEALPGVVTTVDVEMMPPPPPPPPPPPGQSPMELRAAQHARERAEHWTGGGWDPIPLVMPWTFADVVPSGVVIDAGVGYGDLTSNNAFDFSTAGVPVASMGGGLSLPFFVGYRLPMAPMFAVGGYFQYQFDDVPTYRNVATTNGRGYSLHGGVKLRVYFPLGLLEPFVGFGAGYAYARQSMDRGLPPMTPYEFYRTLKGVMLPLEFGLDVVPLSFLTAGLWFQYAFGQWLEWCEIDTAPGAHGNQCLAPGDSEWPTDRPDTWTIGGHVTFYIPTQ